jgi:hypothetical protein
MRPLAEKIAFLRRIFRGASLSRDGVNIAVKCPEPSCSSNMQGKRKFSIKMDTDQAQCWVCGLKTHSSLVPVLRKFCTPDQIHEYIEKYLPAQGRKKLSNLDVASDSIEQVIDFPEDFRLLALEKDSRDPDTRSAIKYLRKRGLTDKELWFYKFGVSNESKFRRRVIMPSFDRDGYINFYTSRGIDQKVFPKYVVPSSDKTAIIFNECNIDWNEEITIVEGPFDLVKCNQNATCLQGSGLTEDYILFWKIVQNKTPVLLALDKDAQRKSHKFAKLLSEYGVQVRILDLGNFEDVGEMSNEEFKIARTQAERWERMTALRSRIARLTSSGSL